jgi:crossover junction endodeoxyribonuclease RuvC
MIILGIDPGYDRCGWAVISLESRQVKPIAFDVVQTSKKQAKYERFAQIFSFLQEQIQQYSVEEIAIEELFFARNVNTALPVSEVRGLIFSLAIQQGIPVAEYKPNQIKQTVTGHGQADKTQVLKMVMRQFGLEKIPKIDDTGDALAVALTHAVHRNSRLK